MSLSLTVPVEVNSSVPALSTSPKKACVEAKPGSVRTVSFAPAGIVTPAALALPRSTTTTDRLAGRQTSSDPVGTWLQRPVGVGVPLAVVRTAVGVHARG